jgi:hypothetical protein
MCDLVIMKHDGVHLTPCQPKWKAVAEKPLAACEGQKKVCKLQVRRVVITHNYESDSGAHRNGSSANLAKVVLINSLAVEYQTATTQHLKPSLPCSPRPSWFSGSA